MTTSHELLQALLAQSRIRLRDGAILHRDPKPMPSDFDFSRVAGMMLGLAIGDALGNTSEGQSAGSRTAAHGEIRDYLVHPRWGDCMGYPSDDSQMAFWTLEKILEDGRFVPQYVLEVFAKREIFGIGSSVRDALNRYHSGSPWQECGVQSAGNGALMRIAPILIPHLRAPSPELWADASLCAMLTHNDSMAISSCVAFIYLLWELLRRNTVPKPEWWVETFISILRELESCDGYEARSPALAGFRGPLWKLLEVEVARASRENLSTREACDRWYSGAYLLETVPCVLYILMRHGQDPEEAIVRAINDTWDNDTVGAIVGAAVGALHGRDALPHRWISGLSGRTMAQDDGRIDDLLGAAESLFR